MGEDTGAICLVQAEGGNRYSLYSVGGGEGYKRKVRVHVIAFSPAVLLLLRVVVVVVVVVVFMV